MRLTLTRLLLFVAVVLIPVSCSSSKYILNGRKDVSPYDFGLASAKTGVERYNVLLETHQAAIAAGVNVDYTGIKQIDIEIPKDTKSIPLTQKNDFKNCTFQVKNTTRNGWLFTTTAESRPIYLSGKVIDEGIFYAVPQLKSGKFLLIIEDENPWVEKRQGYNFGHKRQDILLIENGCAKNTVTQSYNNAESKPICKFIVTNDQPLEVMNLNIQRDQASTAISMVCWVSGYDDVRFKNITVNTPKSDLSEDRVLRVTNSTNVTFTDVRINGTYSQKKKYGYGISLDNVWNFHAKRLHGSGNWGIFGNNNINTAFIEDSEINRFDIHCYGRDVSFKNVKFFDLYNQFSSLYGKVSFEGCEFSNFIPVLIETSYNAYTDFDVNITNCVFYTTSKKNYLVNTGSLTGDVNVRRELSEKRLPRITVNNLKVISLETGEEIKQVDQFLKQGNFIKERNINNVIKL